VKLVIPIDTINVIIALENRLLIWSMKLEVYSVVT